MTKRTNRGRLPNPDRRGYVRPEVGDKRFSVGNIRDVGTSEMERRLADPAREVDPEIRTSR